MKKGRCRFPITITHYLRRFVKEQCGIQPETFNFELILTSMEIQVKGEGRLRARTLGVNTALLLECFDFLG